MAPQRERTGCGNQTTTNRMVAPVTDASYKYFGGTGGVYYRAGLQFQGTILVLLDRYICMDTLLHHRCSEQSSFIVVHVVDVIVVVVVAAAVVDGYGATVEQGTLVLVKKLLTLELLTLMLLVMMMLLLMALLMVLFVA